MSKLRVNAFTASADGFGAGPRSGAMTTGWAAAAKATSLVALICAKGTVVASASSNYLTMTPHAMRSPAFPAGSLTMSSALAWITNAVPPLANTE